MSVSLHLKIGPAGMALLFATLLTGCVTLEEEAEYCGPFATKPINTPPDKKTLLALAKAYKALSPDEDSSHKPKLFSMKLPAPPWNRNLASAWFHTGNADLLLCRYPMDSDRSDRNAGCENVYYEFKKEQGDWTITKAYTPFCVY